MNTTKQSHASVYDIPERPKARAPKLPLLRYEEDCPTIKISDADEGYCLTGYGEISVSEHYVVDETGEDKEKLRVPRLRHTRPRARYQTVTYKAVSDPLELECFRNTVQATSTSRSYSPNTDFREFFDNLLRKTPPTRRRRRSLILQTSFASEAIDAGPRQN